jgi:hypothetical protein
VAQFEFTNYFYLHPTLLRFNRGLLTIKKDWSDDYQPLPQSLKAAYTFMEIL